MMKIFKRVFDIATAAAALLLVSPLLVIVAVAEKLTGQDVFFKQDRVGIGLQPFGVLKIHQHAQGFGEIGNVGRRR